MQSLPFGDRSAVQLFHRFEAQSPGKIPLALFASGIDGRAEAFLNFAPVRALVTSSGSGILRPASRNLLWEVPPDYILKGENRFDLVVSGSSTRAVAGPVYLGPKAELEAAANAGLRVSRTASWLVLALSVLAFVINLVAAAMQSPARHLAVAAAFSACGTRTFLAQVGGVNLSPIWPSADPLLLAAMAICAGLAFHEPTPVSRQRRNCEAGLLIVSALLASAAVVAGSRGAHGAVFWATTLCGLAGVAFFLLAIASAGGRVATMTPRRQIIAGSVAGLSLICAPIVIVSTSAIILPFQPLGLEIALASALSGLALLAAAWGSVRLIQGARYRLDQAQTIRRQQAQLKAASIALEEKTRQSALLEERQRMARDVHDGIGGQLASLIAQVRMRRITMDHVEKALVGGLSELRFLVSSLDVIDSSFADALATFLDRAQQQVSAAGMTLEWSQTSELAAEVREPQWILNFYRLLQEAITNAVRHSGGDRITISLSDRDGRIIVARIADNGIGFDLDKVLRGRGLANMERRARDFGGTFSLGPSGDGEGLVIVVEAPAPKKGR